MGGFGSGAYYHGSNRVTTEEVKQIDIRWFNKQGYLKRNTEGTLSWNQGGEPSGKIGFQMFNDRMTLNYRYQINGGDWQEVQEEIYFDKTECNYGGVRKWFECPTCMNRVAVLYLNKGRFECRKCSDVVYGSQQESDLDRLTRKARTIRHKLDIGNQEEFNPDNLSDWVYYKPKHMHWKTFKRLKQAENWLQDKINDEFLVKYGMML